MNIDIKKIAQHKVTRLLAAVVVLCVAGMVVAQVTRGTKRHVFYFSVIGTERLVREVRYLPKHPVQGDVQLYVDELLLGPETQRARPLFSLGTKNEFCFVRGKTLYVGLSKDVLYQIPEADTITKGIALLCKNIKKNFHDIKNIALFIDGKYVE